MLMLLSLLLFQNEADRKTRHGGYIELSHTDNRAVNNIKLDRDSYLESFRASKKQIERSLENRPTLLHRHNEV